MKCPLLISAGKNSAISPKEPGTNCLKKKCAWWEHEGEGCAILLLGLRLGTVCDQLTDLLAKIPHVDETNG